MKLICIGDIVSREGAEYLQEKLPMLRRQYKPDAVIVNGENSALGNGIDKVSYDMIMEAGADVVTGGNHSFQKKNAQDIHDDCKRLLCPANVPEYTGCGETVLDMGRFSLRVINLSGSLFMKECENPFEYMQKALEREKNAVTVVDFHAEATGEKRAMGFMLDGKVSLVVGTHTHVQTNDAQILPNGTGYITDLGMTGVKNSVIGKDVDVCIHNFLTPDDRLPVKDGKGNCILCGIYAEIDTATKKCTKLEIINIDN